MIALLKAVFTMVARCSEMRAGWLSACNQLVGCVPPFLSRVVSRVMSGIIGYLRQTPASFVRHTSVSSAADNLKLASKHFSRLCCMSRGPSPMFYGNHLTRLDSGDANNNFATIH